MMRKIYILDFDGTLGDSRGLILRTMMDTFDALGIDRPTEEACVNTIGLPLADCFVVAAGLSAAQGERCAEVYRRIFHDNNVPGSVPPFEGVVETIRTLHQQGHTLAVATSRRHESLDELLAEFGVTDLFSMIVAADDVTHAKPDPEPVNKILETLQFQPQEALVVGDAPYDILMGRNRGKDLRRHLRQWEAPGAPGCRGGLSDRPLRRLADHRVGLSGPAHHTNNQINH